MGEMSNYVKDLLIYEGGDTVSVLGGSAEVISKCFPTAVQKGKMMTKDDTSLLKFSGRHQE